MNVGSLIRGNFENEVILCAAEGSETNPITKTVKKLPEKILKNRFFQLRVIGKHISVTYIGFNIILVIF